VEADLGVPAESIIERARGADIQLIALATHGRSGVSRLLMGSVAEQVIRHTPVPVLVVRPELKPENKETQTD
jgi:nucleotide-binding universal stress UspA family protein